MSELRPNRSQRLDLPAAASFLSLPEEAVQALVGSGYLAAVVGADGAQFALGDLKAFVARNDHNGAEAGFLLPDALAEPVVADPQALLDALDGRCEEMARRALEIFASVFPEAQTWPLNEQARFVEQATNRFEAILAVTGQGASVDEALVDDLQEVGAAAAYSGSPLPQLLVVLRISRDLVVQTAVELSEEHAHSGLALSLLLTRVLPAMDRLTDALARGYWTALAAREEELRSRYEHVVETSSNGVYEADLDGRLQYANPSLGIILGRGPDEFVDALLSDVFVPLDPAASVERLMAEPERGGQAVQLEVLRSDGVRRVIEVRTTARVRFDEVVGYQGVVRDITTATDLEADKAEFLQLVTRDLRAPLAILLGQGANLEAHATELAPDQVARVGSSVRSQAERVSRLADDLADVTRLDSSQLGLSTRSVDLAQVVGAALGSVRRPDSVEVRIPLGVEVLADPRRLEQVVANLVDHGLEHAEGQVVVQLDGASPGVVEFSVSAPGPPVSEAQVATLLAGLRTLDHGPGRPSLGLALARGLLESMGGRLTYEVDDDPRFRVVLPVPGRRERG